EELATTHPIAPRLDFVWTPLESTPKRALAADAAKGEVGKFGLGVTFPHELGKTNDPAHAVGATPLASEILLEAALAGLDAMHPDLLDVSFSAHDLAAHAWGQESWEATDVLFRLDGVIGKLLDALDARYGKDGWSLVLSADHGGPHMPELGAGNVRVDLDAVETQLRAIAPIDAVDERYVWLKDGKAIDAVVAALRSTPGIGFAFRTDAFAKHADCTGLPELEMLACNSVHPGRSGDVIFGPREGSFVQRKPFEADFHGTPYAYDREVPIVVREPGRAPRIAENEGVTPLRVAPTVARLLGVAPPPAAREPPL
ncbi:MAG TPA: alkaline phosphatase family protein, partial [Labilithrix sp.]